MISSNLTGLLETEGLDGGVALTVDGKILPILTVGG